MFVFMFLILPGLICLYALVIRGLLMKVTVLKTFYTDANTFWQKVWAICGNSLTIAWSNIVGGVGTLLTFMDPIATMLGDPDFKTQVAGALQSDPKILGYIMMGISLVTILARVHTISKGA